MTQLAMQVLFTLLETTAGSDEISSDLQGSWSIIRTYTYLKDHFERIDSHSLSRDSRICMWRLKISSGKTAAGDFHS